MILWKSIIDIGHTTIMLPLAAAIAGWLLAGGAWKRSLVWCVMFVAGVSLVAFSKVAFLGWATGIPALGFKALSGHVLCASVVLPVFCHVLAHRARAAWRAAAVGSGVAASVGLGMLIVYFDFHSASEAIATFILGMTISLGYLQIAATMPAPRINRASISCGMLVFALVFALKPSVISHKLDDVALHLSGRERPVAWPRSLVCKARAPLKW